MLEQFIIIIHIIAAISIVALILLQQGKGADMGASFGAGASQTVLGVQGGGNLLTHSTAVFVAIFFATSLSLAYVAKQKTGVDPDKILIEALAPATAGEAEIPQVDAAVQAPAPTPVADKLPQASQEAAPASVEENHDHASESSGDIPE